MWGKGDADRSPLVGSWNEALGTKERPFSRSFSQELERGAEQKTGRSKVLEGRNIRADRTPGLGLLWVCGGSFAGIELFWSGDCCCSVVVRAPGAFPLGAES